MQTLREALLSTGCSHPGYFASDTGASLLSLFERAGYYHANQLFSAIRSDRQLALIYSHTQLCLQRQRHPKPLYQMHAWVPMVTGCAMLQSQQCLQQI
jgi:hypothetical protein